jgi:hypothetical protein
MADHIQSLAAMAGIPYYKKASSFNGKGSAIGVVNGYLTAFGDNKVGDTAAVVLLMRFNSVADHEVVRQAVVASPLVLEALGEKKWSKKMEARFTVGIDFLTFAWGFSLRHPSAEKVLALQKAIVEAIKPYAQPHDKHCDLCSTGKVSEVILYNGMPGYYCEACQAKQGFDAQQAAIDYAARETNLVQGLLFGAIAALAGALAWGLVAYGLNRIFLWGSVLIGLMIAKALFHGMGKVNIVGQVAVFVLTIASVLFGDVIFYTLSVMKSQNVPFSFHIVTYLVTHIIEVESEGNGIISLIFATFGAGYVVFTAARKPKFEAKFEKLETPEQSFTATAGR